MKKAFSLAVLVALSGSVFAADPQPAPVPNLAKPGARPSSRAARAWSRYWPRRGCWRKAMRQC